MAEQKQQVSVDLLEVILLGLMGGQQTGILTVQRSKAGVRDVGTIILFHGEVVEAHAGDRLGIDAIQWLYTWGRCQCEFLPKAPAEIIISPPPPIPSVADISISPLSFLSRFLTGKNQEGDKTPIIEDPPSPHIVYNQAADKETDEYPAVPEASFPNITYSQKKVSQETPIPPFFTQEPPPYVPQGTVSAQGNSDASFAQWLRHGSQPKEQAPCRLWQGPEALAFLNKVKAPRLHKHVFLLLDGQRTIDDLVRITGHSFEEIGRLLNDLEQLGMIK